MSDDIDFVIAWCTGAMAIIITTAIGYAIVELIRNPDIIFNLILPLSGLVIIPAVIGYGIIKVLAVEYK